MSEWGEPDESYEPDGSTNDGLSYLVERQRDLLISVATGTTISHGYEVAYKRRRRSIRAGVRRLSLTDPFPWPDLYQWWAHCKQWGTYAERRAYVHSVAEPLLQQLEELPDEGLTDWSDGQDVSWQGLEKRLDGLKKRYNEAVSLDDLQDTGRRAREVILDAVNLAFDSSMVPEGREQPKGGDAKNQIDYILDAWFKGRAHADARKLLRTSWDLANTVTHSDSVTRAEAFAAAQATVLLVRTLAELASEQSPDGEGHQRFDDVS
jgi:hypothetical protein